MLVMILVKNITLSGSDRHRSNYILPYDENDPIDVLMMERHYSKCEIVWNIEKMNVGKVLMPNGHKAEYWNCDTEIYARFADGSSAPLTDFSMPTVA